MLDGLIYRDEEIIVSTIGQAGIDVDDYYSFARDDDVLNDVYSAINHLQCAERKQFLDEYVIPTNVGSGPIYFIEPVEYLQYQLWFEVMLIARGGVAFEIVGTTSQGGGYVYSGQEFRISGGNAISYPSPIYPTPFANGVFFRQSVNSAAQIQSTGNMYTRFNVKRVVGIDPLYFLDDCKFPPIPNPNNSIVSTTQPGDISWHERWGITMPPKETKQPLANHSRPLNILTFLK